MPESAHTARAVRPRHWNCGACCAQRGFSRSESSGALTSETGPPAGTVEATRAVAQSHLVRLRGLLGELALAQGWATADELELIAEALVAWGEAPDAFYARPSFTAIGWA